MHNIKNQLSESKQKQWKWIQEEELHGQKVLMFAGKSIFLVEANGHLEEYYDCDYCSCRSGIKFYLLWLLRFLSAEMYNKIKSLKFDKNSPVNLLNSSNKYSCWLTSFWSWLSLTQPLFSFCRVSSSCRVFSLIILSSPSIFNVFSQSFASQMLSDFLQSPIATVQVTFSK